MKKLSKLKLSTLSKVEMEKREMNKLSGGYTCCICGCGDYISYSSQFSGSGSMIIGYENESGGYGCGEFK